MFALSYVLIVLLAGIPLARTLLAGRGETSQIAFFHRFYRDRAYTVATILAAGFDV